MPRFAANLSMLFREFPVLERPSAARDAGFAGVEILFPYDEPGHLIRQALDRAGLPLILINTPPPNWTGGDRGFAAIPGGEERFRHDFRRALRYAQVLGARHIHVMAGVAEGPEARDTFIRNLAWAAATAPEQPLTIEPINTHDMPGYFLDDFDLAAEVLDTVGAPNLALQFDAYHAHRITGDVMDTWAAHGHRAAHVQVAGYPGRHEPAGGEIDYPAFFARLDSDGYAGFVSGEYTPEGRTGDGVGWIT
ncbi:TIM barrel protein [uncultured Roseovarius sp.]|uniref:hydroxypyruvate isomerase family protein n=1 Tax=uncultured Roseovarius sp. TaxID=293344 RepID=UPI0025957405|nr:TIM barrel protein [uncultured Roseovarius sp.]